MNKDIAFKVFVTKMQMFGPAALVGLRLESPGREERGRETTTLYFMAETSVPA